MAPPFKISSLQNPRVKLAASIAGNRKARTQHGLFVVEGCREIQRAMISGYQPTQVFAQRNILSSEGEAILKTLSELPEVEHFDVTPEVFAKLAMREDKDGLYVTFKQKNHDLLQLRLPENPLILAVHGVEKPGNLGALLRSADGAGASAVVILGGTVDLYNAHVIRGSLGTIFSCQVALASEEAFRHLCRERQIQVVAAALSDRSIPHFSADLSRSTAILVGSEAYGLPSTWLEWADQVIKIPMCGIADSLNVSAAGGIILYEALRQREYRSRK